MSGSRTAKSFFWSLLEQGAPKLFSIIVQIILARLLAPDLFGQLAILLVFIELMNVIAQGGLGMALIQADGVTDKSYTTAFWLSLIVAAFLYCLMFFCAPLIAAFYGIGELTVYIRVLSVVVFINAFNSIQRSYLQKEMNFKALFQVNLVATTLSGITSIILAFAGCGIWALIFQIMLQSLLFCVFMGFRVPWKPSICFERQTAKRLFSFGWEIMATGILDVLCNGLAELIIGRTCNTSELGYYSQGRKWPLAAMGIVASGIQNVMFPMFASIKNDAERFRATVIKALSAGSFLFMPVCFALIAIAAPLVELLLTDVWLPSVLIFQITSAQYILAMPQIVNLRAYMALGDSKLYLKLQIVKLALIMVVVCATALITADIYCVAIANCIVGVFNVLIVDLQPAKRKLGIGRLKQLAIIVPMIVLGGVALGVSLATSFFSMPPALEIAIRLVLFVAVYVGGSWLFKIPGYRAAIGVLKNLRSR